MTIWFEVEDLFEYARAASRPSGIQRLSYELYAALQASWADRIAFVRHDLLNGTLRVVDWSDVQAVYASMNHERRPHAIPIEQAQPNSTGTPLLETRGTQISLVRGALRAVARRMPAELRQPLGEALRGQLGAIRGLSRAAGAVPGILSTQRRGAQLGGLATDRTASNTITAEQDLHDIARPGDWLVVLGSPWSHPDYAGLVERIAATRGLRFGMLVYDLIPVLRPEFCDCGIAMLFSRFMRRCLPISDRLLAISEATVSDIVRWSAREGIILRDTPRAIPIGTGFTAPPTTNELPQGLAPGGYALFVSTIEARKNHILAFRAWRRLLEELPPEKVPTLVFAGRIGWMIADLMQQIRNADFLDGKLVLVEEPNDATLTALYCGARFTLFPSLYEGWGLPVSESLAFGKVCVASGSTSMPEAGGRFCLYHDPDSVTEAVALYRRMIEQPHIIDKLEACILAEYEPTSWHAGAQTVMEAFS